MKRSGSHKKQKVTVIKIQQATRNAVDSNNDDLGTSPANTAHCIYSRSVLVDENNLLIDLRDDSHQLINLQLTSQDS